MSETNEDFCPECFSPSDKHKPDCSFGHPVAPRSEPVTDEAGTIQALYAGRKEPIPDCPNCHGTGMVLLTHDFQNNGHPYSKPMGCGCTLPGQTLTTISAPLVPPSAQTVVASFCPECGPNVTVDAEGCCVTCGSNAMGQAVSQLRRFQLGQGWVTRVTNDPASDNYPSVIGAPQPSSDRETAWVIERRGHVGTLFYWKGHQQWSTEHLDAMRFADKASGETEKEFYRLHDALVVEHMWIVPAPPKRPSVAKEPTMDELVHGCGVLSFTESDGPRRDYLFAVHLLAMEALTARLRAKISEAE